MPVLPTRISDELDYVVVGNDEKIVAGDGTGDGFQECQGELQAAGTIEGRKGAREKPGRGLSLAFEN